MDKINLVKDTIDEQDIDSLIEWLKGYPRLTKGKLNLEFEKKFAKWMGREYSVFCNSGSSANLLMLSALNQHSKYNIDKVNNLATKHGLNTHKERWVNNGAWVVTN